MYTGKVSPPENCIIEPGPPKVKASQKPTCKYQTSQVRYDFWMLLAPPVPEVRRPSSQRFLEDLQMFFVPVEYRLTS